MKRTCLLTAVILFSFFLSGCVTVGPQAIEDSNDGPVLVVSAAQLQKVVENWGYENGFQYVAYRRLTSRITVSSSGGAQTNYWVSVKGINDPKDAPENYNVFTVPSTPHKELTYGAQIAIGVFSIIGGIFLVPLLAGVVVLLIL